MALIQTNPKAPPLRRCNLSVLGGIVSPREVRLGGAAASTVRPKAQRHQPPRNCSAAGHPGERHPPCPTPSTVTRDSPGSPSSFLCVLDRLRGPLLRTMTLPRSSSGRCRLRYLRLRGLPRRPDASHGHGPTPWNQPFAEHFSNSSAASSGCVDHRSLPPRHA